MRARAHLGLTHGAVAYGVDDRLVLQLHQLQFLRTVERLAHALGPALAQGPPCDVGAGHQNLAETGGAVNAAYDALDDILSNWE